MRLMFAVVVLVITLGTVVVPGYAFNLSQMLGSGEEQDLNTFKLIHVADLQAMMANQGNKLHLYDANGAATREQFGTIPGAALLDTDDSYPLSVLPSDKHSKLVFYCANTH